MLRSALYVAALLCRQPPAPCTPTYLSGTEILLDASISLTESVTNWVHPILGSMSGPAKTKVLKLLRDRIIL